jgi:hypothetical protein
MHGSKITLLDIIFRKFSNKVCVAHLKVGNTKTAEKMHMLNFVDPLETR